MFMKIFTMLLLTAMLITVYARGNFELPGNRIDAQPENKSEEKNALRSGPISGFYTINSSLPTAGNNFNNFTDLAGVLNNYGVGGTVEITVAVGSSPYNEQVILGVIPGSNSENTITINGNGGVLQYLSTNTNERATLKLNGTDYVTIDNMIFKALGTTSTEYGFTVQLMNGADFNTFTNCEFITDISSTTQNYAAFVAGNNATNAATAGLAVNYLTIDHCRAVGGYQCLVVNGPTIEPWSMGNSVTNTSVEDFNQFGLYIRGQNNSVFEDNEISRPVRTVISTTYMLYLANDMSGSKVMNNHIHTLAAQGVAVTSTSYGIYGTSVAALENNPLLIANNLVYGFTGMNGGQYGIYMATLPSAPSFVKIYHNTVALDNVSHPGGSLARGIYHGGATNAGGLIDIKNNLIYITTNSTGNKHFLYFLNANANISSNFNVLFNGAVAGTNHIGFWNSTNYSTFAEWQALGFDGNSVNTDPMFADLNGENLTPTSPVVDNIGTNLLAYVPKDLYGTPRSATPDPGAIEFLLELCPVPNNLLASQITASSALLSWTPGGSESAWNLEWEDAGFTPGEGTLIEGILSDSEYFLSKLSPSSSYDYYVQADCGIGAKLSSEWVGPFTFTTNEGQMIMIPASGQWGFISSFINLEGKMMLEDAFADILDEMVILIGTNGIFWPGQNINTIGEWDSYRGYKLKMNQNGHLVFPGLPVENKSVTFTAGIHTIPVLCENPVAISDVIDLEDVTFIFDLNGNIYWPEGGIFTLSTLVPGYGYLAKFNKTTTLDFASAKTSVKPDAINALNLSSPWSNVIKTGELHLIGVSAAATRDLKPGDIIGVFNAKGWCTGIAAFAGQEQPFLMVVYGDDQVTESKDGMTEAEQMIFKLYRDGKESLLQPLFDQTLPNHTSEFVLNGLSIIKELKDGLTGSGDEIASKITILPNPSSGILMLKGAEMPLEIEVLSIDGIIVYQTILTTESLDLRGLSRGIYFLRVVDRGINSIQKIIIQ